MKLEVVTMTPEWAAKILKEQNTSNRHMRTSIVRRYAHAILAGQWKLTQQGIAIGSNGVLLDGQHRLAAIVMADRPVSVALATECDPGIFTVIDAGFGRRASDALQMNGVGNSTTVAAGLKLYLLHHLYPDKIWTGSALHYPSHQEIHDLNAERPEEVALAAKRAVSAYQGFKKINKGASVAFALLCSDAGWEDYVVGSFLERLASGVGLSGDSPVLCLRTALINEALGRAKKTNPAQLQLACLIKAFNYERDSVSLRLFKAPSIPPMPTLLRP